MDIPKGVDWNSFRARSARGVKMTSKLPVVAGIGVLVVPFLSLTLSSSAISGSGRTSDSAIVLAQAQPEPAGVHAAIGWAQARLSEIDATLQILEENAGKLDKGARENADETLQKLKASREAYRATIEAALANGEQQTEAQIAATHTSLDVRWNEFELGLENYLGAIHSNISLRKSIFEARVKAEEDYRRQAVESLRASAAKGAAEQRGAIEARIAESQAQLDLAKARLVKFEQAGDESWNALKEGLDDVRVAFDKADEAIRAAITRAKH